jgi:hypothetical protein
MFMVAKKRAKPKWTFTEEELDRQFAEATRAGEEAMKREPRAKSVVYESSNKRLIIELLNGRLIGIPVDEIQGLGKASDADILSFELSSLGDSVRWDSLDLEFGIAGLASGVLGNRAWMAELGRKGGAVSSEAKAAAARENGRKGGRPRNVQVFAIRNSETFQAVALQQDVEFLDTDLSDQSHMATEAVVEYERMIVAGYQKLMRERKATKTQFSASLISGAELPTVKASLKLPHTQIKNWSEGVDNAELPIAA